MHLCCALRGCVIPVDLDVSTSGTPFIAFRRRTICEDLCLAGDGCSEFLVLLSTLAGKLASPDAEAVRKAVILIRLLLVEDANKLLDRHVTHLAPALVEIARRPGGNIWRKDAEKAVIALYVRMATKKARVVVDDLCAPLVLDIIKNDYRNEHLSECLKDLYSSKVKVSRYRSVTVPLIDFLVEVSEEEHRDVHAFRTWMAFAHYVMSEDSQICISTPRFLSAGLRMMLKAIILLTSDNMAA